MKDLLGNFRFLCEELGQKPAVCFLLYANSRESHRQSFVVRSCSSDQFRLRESSERSTRGRNGRVFLEGYHCALHPEGRSIWCHTPKNCLMRVRLKYGLNLYSSNVTELYKKGITFCPFNGLPRGNYFTIWPVILTDPFYL